MCGITGYINLNSKTVKDTSGILAMLKVQKHRGPDDSGIMAFNLQSGQFIDMGARDAQPIDGNFNGVIGFNRLSILDLSLNGHQPMVSSDKKVLLTLNGEIYNAFDYKKELEYGGYNFKSTTDTEIVLALYLKYGLEKMLGLLNGMFAIVIADLNLGELFIARDRFGIKPMYYISKSDTFAFSSELKSFRFLNDFYFKLAEEQLDEYLLFRNNLNGTLFKEIQSLTPGHYLSFSNAKGIIIKRYFDINSFLHPTKTSGDIDSYCHKLEGWLDKSVHSQLISDVKLGCQLSGGIDSSLVTWLANKHSDKGNFESVSIIFDNEKFNEENYIDRVTEKLALTSHKFLLDSNYYLDNIEKVTWHLEAPINHPNTVAIYKLSQMAKEHVTVLLSGEGADEVFGGYNRFYDISFPFHSRKLLHEMKKNLKHLRYLADYFDHKNRAVMATSFITLAIAKKLYVGFNKETASAQRISLYNSLSGSLFDRQVKYEMLTYMPDLLIRQDKMSMAHSIENRVPFLDNEVVQNSFTIPENYLLIRKSNDNANPEKYLLKKMTSYIFGNDFAFRDKMGFGIPVKEFFLNSEFVEYLKDKILPNIRKRGLFNFTLVSRWISNINHLNYIELEALWIMVSFEIWASVYLEGIYENSNSPY